jgi:hypothetical protein
VIALLHDGFIGMYLLKPLIVPIFCGKSPLIDQIEASDPDLSPRSNETDPELSTLAPLCSLLFVSIFAAHVEIS